MAKIVSQFNDVEYLKSNKNWCVRVFKYLGHDEMVGSRICMFKDVNLSNKLLPVVYFAPLDGWVKILNIYDF